MLHAHEGKLGFQELQRSAAAQEFQWLEFFSGSGMAMKCLTSAGFIGYELDILNHTPPLGKQNYMDLESPVGMACLSLNSTRV